MNRRILRLYNIRRVLRDEEPHYGCTSDCIAPSGRECRSFGAHEQEMNPGQDEGNAEHSNAGNTTAGATDGRDTGNAYRVLGERHSVSMAQGKASHGARFMRAADRQDGTSVIGNATEEPAVSNETSQDVTTEAQGTVTPSDNGKSNTNDNASGNKANGTENASENASKSNGGTNKDDNNNDMPVIITAVIGGIVVVTVMAAGLYRNSKDKNDSDNKDA